MLDSTVRKSVGGGYMTNRKSHFKCGHAGSCRCPGHAGPVEISPVYLSHPGKSSRLPKDRWLLVTLCLVIAFSSLGSALTVIRHMSQVRMSALIATPVVEPPSLGKARLWYRGLWYQQPTSQPDNRVHLESFDYVWSKIKETYWEDDFGGVDWDQARKELRPKIEKAKDIQEVRKIMGELIKRLGKSHYAIIPGSAYQATQLARRGNSDSGITFRYSGGRVLVAAVRSDSDAARVGVSPGWEIVQAGDVSVPAFLEKAKSYQGLLRLDTLIGLSFGNLLTGTDGQEKKCVFVDPDGNRHEMVIKLSRSPGKVVQFGNLPNMRIDMESRLLESNVGYFRFNGFFDPVRLMPAFRKAVREFESADGLIIDIRGNGGGIVGMTMGMASPLTDKPAPLGVMKMKKNELKLNLFRSAKPYTKKVAVLVDEASASASEIYAGGLQDLKIARVFGRRTAGLSLPSTVEKLPNGDRFQYAIANYTSASGKVLEGNGVVPDETITLTPENLSQQVDPVLKRALEWIRSPSN